MAIPYGADGRILDLFIGEFFVDIVESPPVFLAIVYVSKMTLPTKREVHICQIVGAF